MVKEKMKARWNFTQEDFMVIATPDMAGMQDFVKKACDELSRNIVEFEEKLILKESKTEVLYRLKEVIEKELAHREMLTRKLEGEF